MKHLCGTLPSRSLSTQPLYRPTLAPSALGGDQLLVTRWNTWLRRQQTPSCLGHAIITLVEIQVGDAPRLSGVSLWREARRQQGRIERIDEGARVEYGLSALYERGWSDPWRPGEEADPVEAGLGANDAGDDPFDELSAYDTIHRSRSERIGASSALTDIQLALQSNVGVLWAGGTRDPFYSLRRDELVTPEHLGGYAGGHAMTIVGRAQREGELAFLMRNTWGPNWGGATVNGVLVPGLFWASPSAVLQAWEHHVIRIHSERLS